MGPHMAFFVLAALVLLILRAFNCSLSGSKRSTSGLRKRGLAGGKEGPWQGGEDQTGLRSCWTVGELVAPQWEAGSSGIPLPSAAAAASAEDEAAAVETQKRKRKRKTKTYPEESSEKQAKTARESRTETLQSTGELSNPLEGPSPGPSSASRFRGSHLAELLIAGTGIVFRPFSLPRTGTLPEDSSSSESEARSSSEGPLAVLEDLSDEAIVEGLLDEDLVGLEDWFLDSSAPLPLFPELDDSSQVSPDPQPSELSYDIPIPVKREEIRQLLSEEVAHQQGQHQSPSPFSPVEGTSRTHSFFQYSPVMADPDPQKVAQVAPSTSSAIPGALPHSLHTYSLPPHISPSSEAIPSTSRRSTAFGAASQRELARRRPAPLTKEQCMAHPFYVLPTVERGGALKPFSVVRVRDGSLRTLDEVVMPIRSLLRRSHLATGDLQTLIYHGERLYGHAQSRLPVISVNPSSPRQLLPWARRLLIVHCLWCVCEVVGEPMQKSIWWNSLFSQLLRRPSQSAYTHMGGSRGNLLPRLIAALEDFSQGQHPVAEQLVPLLQAIFDQDAGVAFFKTREWDPWREDDRRYMESLRRQQEEREGEKSQYEEE